MTTTLMRPPAGYLIEVGNHRVHTKGCDQFNPGRGFTIMWGYPFPSDHACESCLPEGLPVGTVEIGHIAPPPPKKSREERAAEKQAAAQAAAVAQAAADAAAPAVFEQDGLDGMYSDPPPDLT